MAKQITKKTISDAQLKNEFIKLFESINNSNYHLFKNSKPLKYYVYGLYDVLNEKIFYVGKGKGKRAWKHINIDGCNKLKDNYILTLLMKMEQHEVIIFEDNLIEEEAMQKEAILIEEKYNELTNIKIESTNLSVYEMLCAKYGKDNVWIDETALIQENAEVVTIEKAVMDARFIIKNGKKVGDLYLHNGKSYSFDNIIHLVK